MGPVLALGNPITDRFLQILNNKAGRVLEDKVWASAHQAPWERATCSWAARILPHPPCPWSWFGRGSGSSPNPAPLPPSLDCRDQARPPWALPCRLTPSQMDPGKGPTLSAYRRDIRTISNPLAILLAREVGGRKCSSRPALGHPAGPRQWQCQPARQPSPRPGPSPTRQAASGWRAWPQLLPHLGSSSSLLQPPPSKLRGCRKGDGRGGAEGRACRPARYPPSQPLSLGEGSPAHLYSCQAGCPGLPGSGVCVQRPKQRPAPGPHRTPPPRLPGPGDPRVPEEMWELLLPVVFHTWRRRRGRTAFTMQILFEWGN